MQGGIIAVFWRRAPSWHNPPWPKCFTEHMLSCVEFGSVQRANCPFLQQLQSQSCGKYSGRNMERSCSSHWFPNTGSGHLPNLFSITEIQTHTLPGQALCLAWALTQSMVNSPNLVQGEGKFWSENVPYMEGMVEKKLEIIHAYLTCLVFRHLVTLYNLHETG